MSENITETVIGALVIAAAAFFLFFAAGSIGTRTHDDGYRIHAEFRDVGGIIRGTDVRLAGVKIGTVSDLSLDMETYFADVTLAIDEGVSIPVDSAVEITMDGLLGGNHVQIIPGAEFEYLEHGDAIEDAQGAVSLTTLLIRAFSGEK